MVRLYTEDISIDYGERLIVKDLCVEIPDKKITTIKTTKFVKTAIINIIRGKEISLISLPLIYHIYLLYAGILTVTAVPLSFSLSTLIVP